MSGTFPPPPEHYYVCHEDGLSFTVKIQVNEHGVYYATITVTEGSGDFNALYWGDNVDDGNDYSLGSKLGMNGKGEQDHHGDKVDWDSAVKLSDPGLGTDGTDKDTYLEAGETMVIPLWDVTSFEEITTIGIRATSTSTPEESIKCVLEPVDEWSDLDPASWEDDGHEDDAGHEGHEDEAEASAEAGEDSGEDVKDEDAEDAAAFYEDLAEAVGCVDEDALHEDEDEEEFA